MASYGGYLHSLVVVYTAYRRDGTRRAWASCSVARIKRPPKRAQAKPFSANSPDSPRNSASQDAARALV